MTKFVRSDIKCHIQNVKWELYVTKNFKCEKHNPLENV